MRWPEGGMALRGQLRMQFIDEHAEGEEEPQR